MHNHEMFAPTIHQLQWVDGWVTCRTVSMVNDCALPSINVVDN